MAKAVVELLELPPEKLDLVREAIQTEWVGRIAFVWNREDVVRACRVRGWRYPSAEDCDAVLAEFHLNENENGSTFSDLIAEIEEAGLNLPIVEDEDEETED